MSDLQNNEATCRKNDERAGQTSLRVKGDWGYNGSRSSYILCGKNQTGVRMHPLVCLKRCSKAKKCKWLESALIDMPQQEKTGGIQLELIS